MLGARDVRLSQRQLVAVVIVEGAQQGCQKPPLRHQSGKVR